MAWESFHSANVQFMHGALHLFDAGDELRKYTWVRTNIPLMEQIRAALSDDLLPLFVSEGSTETKFRRICHHAYLHRCFQSFRQIGGSVFIFGHSLAANDDHILRCLESRRSKVKKLFISIYGDPEGPSNKSIIERATRMETRRHERRNKLEVEFFDASCAKVWG